MFCPSVSWIGSRGWSMHPNPERTQIDRQKFIWQKQTVFMHLTRMLCMVSQALGMVVQSQFTHSSSQHPNHTCGRKLKFTLGHGGASARGCELFLLGAQLHYFSASPWWQWQPSIVLLNVKPFTSFLDISVVGGGYLERVIYEIGYLVRGVFLLIN